MAIIPASITGIFRKERKYVVFTSEGTRVELLLSGKILHVMVRGTPYQVVSINDIRRQDGAFDPRKHIRDGANIYCVLYPEVYWKNPNAYGGPWAYFQDIRGAPKEISRFESTQLNNYKVWTDPGDSALPTQLDLNIDRNGKHIKVTVVDQSGDKVRYYPVTSAETDADHQIWIGIEGSKEFDEYVEKYENMVSMIENPDNKPPFLHKYHLAVLLDRKKHPVLSGHVVKSIEHKGAYYDFSSPARADSMPDAKEYAQTYSDIPADIQERSKLRIPQGEAGWQLASKARQAGRMMQTQPRVVIRKDEMENMTQATAKDLKREARELTPTKFITRDGQIVDRKVPKTMVISSLDRSRPSAIPADRSESGGYVVKSDPDAEGHGESETRPSIAPEEVEKAVKEYKAERSSRYVQFDDHMIYEARPSMFEGHESVEIMYDGRWCHVFSITDEDGISQDVSMKNMTSGNAISILIGSDRKQLGRISGSAFYGYEEAA